MVNTKGPSKKKKGRSKRAHVLVAAVEKATENFIEKGEQIDRHCTILDWENGRRLNGSLPAVDIIRRTRKCIL